jgi:hypothetical protein
MTYCHWRRYVLLGYKYQSLDDFDDKQCVLMSPRFCRFEYQGTCLPYFQVESALRRHIWESFRYRKIPKGAVVRHHCTMKTSDSRGACVNPLHLSIGSKDDNRKDAREEHKLRAQQGYWKPHTAVSLDVLPTVERVVDDIHTEYDPDTLWLWSGRDEPLSPQEKEAHLYCNLFATTMGTSIDQEDHECLVKMQDLLAALRANQDTEVQRLIAYFKVLTLGKSRAVKCNRHRSQ